MPQAIACMRSGRMPISIAALRSSATASRRLPRAVRVSTRCMLRVMISASAPASSLEASMRKPPISNVPPTSVSGKETKLAVKAQNAA